MNFQWNTLSFTNFLSESSWATRNWPVILRVGWPLGYIRQCLNCLIRTIHGFGEIIFNKKGQPGKVNICIAAFRSITGLTIGALGIDSCAKETNKTGVCQNVVKAFNTFTVISGDYGQFPAPDDSLTFVSIDVQLEAEYSPIFNSQILSKKRCTDKPCLHDGICHDIKPDGECCFYQSALSPQHKYRYRIFVTSQGTHISGVA